MEWNKIHFSISTHNVFFMASFFHYLNDCDSNSRELWEAAELADKSPMFHGNQGQCTILVLQFCFLDGWGCM